MKVRILTCLAGPDYVWNPGDEPDVEAAEAARLIAAGIAAPVPEAKTERAVAAPVERAAKKA